MVPRRLALLTCSVALVAGLATGVGAAETHVGIDEPTNETLGDVVELTVSVPENGTATVVFESTGVESYSRTVYLNDTSGDGTVTLRVNTFPGREGTDETATYSVTEDELRVREAVGGRMPADSYDIAVYSGTNTDGEPADAATLDLAEPSVRGVTYSIAPAGTADRLDSRAAIARARSEGWLTESETVAAGDTVVLGLRVDGIEGAVASAPVANDTARFTAMLDRANTSLQLEWAYSTMAPTERRTLNRTTIAAVVADSRNDTYYVVLNTTDAHIVPAASENVEDGDDFTPVLTVAGEQRLTGAEYGPPEFEIEQPEGELLTDLGAADGSTTVTIQGGTNLAPGSVVVVELTDGGTSLTSATRTVRQDGTVTVTVGAGTLDRAENITMKTPDGRVIERESELTSLAVPSGQSTTDGQLRVASVTLPSDGYVHVVGPTGTVVGRSDELRGLERNVTIPLSVTEIEPEESLLVVPARQNSIDPDDLSYDNVYLVNGAPPGVSVNITTESVPSSTPTDAGTATASPATVRATDTTTTGADGAGLGVPSVALALIVLGAGYRKRNAR